MNEQNRLIFGKSSELIKRLVSCEVQGNEVLLFCQNEDGSVDCIRRPHRFWMLSCIQLDKGFSLLEGNLYYKYIKLYETKEEWVADKKKYYKRDIYLIHDEKESAMVLYGFSYFQGLKVNDVSILSWDIETTGLNPNDKDAKILLITNTYRKNGIITRKVFPYSDYKNEKELINSWCTWVREIDPTIFLGHNIVIFDLPYLAGRAEIVGANLTLGRDSSDLTFNDYDSKFRKDGSQFYSYRKIKCFGREIVDTFFLSIKYDIGRKYPNYKLKQIIKFEGLEVEGRQHYDASQIRFNYKDPLEWKKIVKYAEHDADDPIALFDLMVPSFFYLNRSIPKSFQELNLSATGSQINSFLVRSYLQEFHSIPKANDIESYEGALSAGFPGLYTNVIKWDVKSMYPSIIMQYKIYDNYKDPLANFLKMVEYFTLERFENKRLAKETGDRYYTDLEQAGKQVINSAYGMMGAKLNFNSPKNAAFVTKKGREILETAIRWATGKDYTHNE